MASSASGPAVDLVIRFTTSIPDLILSIASPKSITTLSLKQQIRAQLPATAASNRLRLISAGKVLPDASALSSSISIPPPPPRSVKDNTQSDKGKGKAPLRASPPPHPNARVYIHCSIGDALTQEELAAEATAAEDADTALLSTTSLTNPVLGNNSTAQAPSLLAPAPRGFDRLLTAGFNPAEVATLRTQFLAIQAHTHTPDTMPVGDDLRMLEDRWLDSDAAGGGPMTGSGGEGGGGAADGGFGAEDGGLEDMLWGNIMGFFWPVAAVCWLMREEGVWTRRRQIAVLSGMLVNLTFGFLRLTN